MRFALRDVHYGDRHGKLDALYRVRDPWGMETERERYRFGETNRIVENEIGHVGSLLEIGCGEGHQSEELQVVCDELYGIDVSARAVERARERCPRGTFAVGDLTHNELLETRERFDLVAACEVLYYMKEIPAIIQRMSELGEWCFVSYYDGQAAGLDGCFESIADVRRTKFRHGETVWNALWWRNGSRDT